MALWPQWRSALVWDFWAITSYIIFSILFWYIGLIPDLATLRDRARTGPRAGFYGALALGWRGSAGHWHATSVLHVTRRARRAARGLGAQRRRPRLRRQPDAGLAGDDLPALLRRRRDLFRLCHGPSASRRWCAGASASSALITLAHFDAMAKIMLAASILMALSYATEWFMAWYGGERAERSLWLSSSPATTRRFTGRCSLFNCGGAAGALVRRGAAQRARPCSASRRSSTSACGSSGS